MCKRFINMLTHLPGCAHSGAAMALHNMAFTIRFGRPQNQSEKMKKKKKKKENKIKR